MTLDQAYARVIADAHASGVQFTITADGYLTSDAAAQLAALFHRYGWQARAFRVWGGELFGLNAEPFRPGWLD